MADSLLPSPQSDDMRPGSRAWRKRVALVLAVALAAAGLFLLEHGPAANAAPGPTVSARAASAASRAAHLATVDAQVAQIKAVTSQLRGAASVLNQTLPDLDGATAATTADVASSATRAAALSQRLAAITAGKTVDPAATNSTASSLQAALAATQAKAAAASRIPIFPLRFCLFTIQIGPIIINIPRLHIHIVIGPFFIRFFAPCFLSGRIPTHVP